MKYKSIRISIRNGTDLVERVPDGKQFMLKYDTLNWGNRFASMCPLKCRSYYGICDNCL